jgi:hypothetical protein
VGEEEKDTGERSGELGEWGRISQPNFAIVSIVSFAMLGRALACSIVMLSFD